MWFFIEASPAQLGGALGDDITGDVETIQC